MKRILAGGFLSLCGVIMNAAIIMAAGFYSPTLGSWSGSRFWYAIFGTPGFDSGLTDSMGLGFLFVTSLIMLLSGIILILIELIHKVE